MCHGLFDELASRAKCATAFYATGARDIAGIKFNLALSALFCTVHHALGYPIQKRGDKVEIKIMSPALYIRDAARTRTYG